jgi:hypothetical protein
MSESVRLAIAGRRRSPATLSGYHAGRVPRNKGPRYADPSRVRGCPKNPGPGRSVRT